MQRQNDGKTQALDFKGNSQNFGNFDIILNSSARNIFTLILSYLRIKDLRNLPQVSKQFKQRITALEQSDEKLFSLVVNGQTISVRWSDWVNYIEHLEYHEQKQEYGLWQQLLNSPSKESFTRYAADYYGLTLNTEDILNLYQIGSNISDDKAKELQANIEKAISLATRLKELQTQQKIPAEIVRVFSELLKVTIGIERALDTLLLWTSCGVGRQHIPWTKLKFQSQLPGIRLEKLLEEPHAKRLNIHDILKAARCYLHFARIVFSKEGAEIFLKKAHGNDILNIYFCLNDPDAIIGVERIALFLKSIQEKTYALSLLLNLPAAKILQVALLSKQAADVVMQTPELVAKLSEDQKQKINQFQRDVSEALEKLRVIAEEKKETALFSFFKIETLQKYQTLLENYWWKENENDPVLYEKDMALQNVFWNMETYINKHKPKQNNTILSNRNPIIEIKSNSTTSASTKTEEVKNSEESLRKNLRDALEYHNNRVESDQKGNKQDFTQGFWIRKKPRGKNREANCKLTKKLIEEIDKREVSIKQLFDKQSIKRLRLQFKIDGNADNSADLHYIFKSARKGEKVIRDKLKKSEKQKQQAKLNRKR